MNTDDVFEYLSKLPDINGFSDLEQDEQDKMIFNATEQVETVLKLYPKVEISPRMVFLQLQYAIEGEDEGTAMMRRQGINDYTIKDVKVTLTDGVISPELLSLIKTEDEALNGRGRVGRLI